MNDSQDEIQVILSSSHDLRWCKEFVTGSEHQEICDIKQEI